MGKKVYVLRRYDDVEEDGEGESQEEEEELREQKAFKYEEEKKVG